MRALARTATLAVTLAAACAIGGAAFAATVRIDGSARSILAEPDVAVDPANPNRVLIVSKDITARGVQVLNSYVSSDGGTSFGGGATVAGSYLGAPADASDPVALFDTGGNAIFGQLVWQYPSRTGFESIIGVQRSVDGGATFLAPTEIVRTSNAPTPVGFGEPRTGSIWHDKEWLAVDRTGGPRAGALYAAWVRIRNIFTGQRSRILFARSTDGGASWSAPQFLSYSERFALGPQIAVAADGSVHAVWASFRRDPEERRARILAARSTDGGQTFSAPIQVASYRNSPGAYNLAALAASGSGGLIACWSRARGSLGSVAQCSRSLDGLTWRQPRAVASAAGRAQDLVAVEAQGANRFWLSMYVRRGGGVSVRLYRSNNGGRTFTRSRVLARRSYVPEGFLGDYTGLDTTPSRVFAAYVLPRRGPRSRNAIYVTSMATP